jgi:hypothetical protein
MQTHPSTAGSKVTLSRSETGLKEGLFLLGVFGLPGVTLLLSSFLGRVDRKALSFLSTIFALGLMGLSLIWLTLEANSFTARFLVCLAITLTGLTLDSSQSKPNSNITVHLINMGYVGVAGYFLLMQRNPENYPVLWQEVSSSSVNAFNMLLLCLLFQNIGYFLIWNLFPVLRTMLIKWAVSSRNLFNLDYSQRSINRLNLICILTALGLISRIWNFTTGRIYYTEGSGIPFLVSSFLAQFDRLYFVGLLYGCALYFEKQPDQKSTKINRLTGLLVSLELLYQLLSGSKGRFFSFVISPIAMVFILVRRRVSWTSVLLLGGLGLSSWLVIYPTLVIYRNLLVTNPGLLSNSIELLSRSFSSLFASSLETYWKIIITPLTRSGVPEQVLAMTSIIHYQTSQASDLLWQRLLFFWVPRFLWVDKPVALSANVIGRLSNRLNPDDLTTSVLITTPGELFLYYGLAGSVLMIFSGLAIRLVNEVISPFKLFSPFRIAVFVTFLPALQVFLGGGFEASLTGLLIQLSILYTTLSLFRVFS